MPHRLSFRDRPASRRNAAKDAAPTRLPGSGMCKTARKNSTRSPPASHREKDPPLPDAVRQGRVHRTVVIGPSAGRSRTAAYST